MVHGLLRRSSSFHTFPHTYRSTSSAQRRNQPRRPHLPERTMWALLIMTLLVDYGGSGDNVSLLLTRASTETQPVECLKRYMDDP